MPRQRKPAREPEFRIGHYWLSKHSSSPYWQRTWYDEGSQQTRRKSLGVEDFQDAKDKLTDLYYAETRPINAEPDDVPIQDILTAYYNEYAVNRPSAVQAEIACGHLSVFFDRKMTGEVTRTEQERYVAARLARGISVHTAARELSVLRAALRRAWKTNVLKSAPFVYDPTDAAMRRDREPKGRPLLPEEMARLFDAAKAEHGFMLLMILANTMCRPDAALDLTVFQRDKEHNLLSLNPPGRKQTKKYRPIVPISSTLRPWLDRCTAGHYVSYAGRRIKSAKTFMRETRKEAGFTVTNADGETIPDKRVNLYSIRHTMARELRKRRVPEEQIELMLGHRLPGQTTQIYAPYDPDYCQQAIAAIDAYFAELQKLSKRPLSGPALVQQSRHAR